jgi:hypothetical protein
MPSVRTRMRQLVDWGAAFRSGLFCGVLVFILSLVFSGILLKSPWFYTRLVSSLSLGSNVLLDPHAFDLGILLLSLVLHMVVALLIALLTAIIIHKYGILISVAGGALIGLAVYAIGFYALSRFFPWLAPFRSWIYMLEFIFYGAIVGGIYELLEVEVYVPEGSKQL